MGARLIIPTAIISREPLTDFYKEEIDYVVEKLQKHIEMIRFFAKKNKR